MRELESCGLYTYLLAAILGLIVALFLLDTIRNFLQVTRAMLGPYFIPQEDISLSKRYGPWACKFLRKLLKIQIILFCETRFP